MKATYYIGGREVAYEEWSGDPRLPEILSQEDYETLRGPDKPRGAEGGTTMVLVVLSFLAWVGVSIAWVLS